MLSLFVTMTVIVLGMIAYLTGVQLALDRGSLLRRAHRRGREARQARREMVDVDREYASLVDEHRRTP